MLDFTIALDAGIIEPSINSYQNLAANKLNLDFLGFTEKVQKKKALSICTEPFGKENYKKEIIA